MSNKDPLTLKVKRLCDDFWCRPRLQVVDENSKCNGMILADVSLGNSDYVNGMNKIPGDWHTTTSDYGEPISRIRDNITLELIEDEKE